MQLVKHEMRCVPLLLLIVLFYSILFYFVLFRFILFILYYFLTSLSPPPLLLFFPSSLLFVLKLILSSPRRTESGKHNSNLPSKQNGRSPKESFFHTWVFNFPTSYLPQIMLLRWPSRIHLKPSSQAHLPTSTTPPQAPFHVPSLMSTPPIMPA